MFRSDDTGKLILRLTLGLLLLLHGLSKITHGVGPIGGMLSAHNLPSALAYLAYVGEVVAPILIIIGLYTRLGGWIIAIHMVVAVSLVHLGQLGSLANTGGWALELQAMFLFSAIVVALLGAGRFAIGGSSGRWN
jgi:putative oxidoreductase